jgi:NADPH-dependent curcumin reductase CurA
MTAAKNRQILLASRPRGEPTLDNFQMAEADVPEPGPGQMLLRTVYLSLDPSMRGRMNAGPSYAPPVEVGGIMEGRAVCEVEKSHLPQYQAGDIVVAGTGWQEYALSDGKGVQKIDPALGPISYALGVLGMPGLTAYTGLLNIGMPQPGETRVVAASGAVGSVVGQIAKIKGRRAIGIAGGESKCRFVTAELGFDACLDHHRADLAGRLQAACTRGIDIYFENVGGAGVRGGAAAPEQFRPRPGVWPHRPRQRDRSTPRAQSRAAVDATPPPRLGGLACRVALSRNAPECRR